MTIQDEEIARLWRKEKEVWDLKDIYGIFESFKGSQGYGYRIKAWSSPLKDTLEQRQYAEKWLDDIEYFRHTDIDLNTWSEDDLGLAWGSYTEEFKHKGQSPEKTRIRFTSTYKKYGDKWRLIMFHKDIQPFTEEGLYLKN